MQHKQFNFTWRGTIWAAVLLSFFAAWPVLAGAIVQPSRPDPLLDSGPTDPCAAAVDYAPAIDVNGHGVVPADVAARPVPLPDSIAIPIGRNQAPGRAQNSASRRRPVPGAAANPAPNRDSSYVVLDGRKLEPLLNPPPCGAVH